MPPSWEFRNHSLEPPTSELALIRAGRTQRVAWEAACAALLERWQTDILRLAKYYAPARSVRADFAQVARMALLRAALTYDETLGHRFENFARRCMRNALIDEARRTRRECALCHAGSVDPFADDTGLVDIIRDEARGLVRERVARWVQRLQVLVDLLYLENLSQSEAARRLCLTPARVCQLCETIRRQGRADFAELADLV